jgi:uncharacterized protein (DUF2147 family)
MRVHSLTSSFPLVCAVLSLFVCPLPAQQNGVLGYWKEPGGSVIHVEACGGEVCAVLSSISPDAPARVDAHNPDQSLRGRSLCGLRIGEGFRLTTPTRAEGGKLYDPKSGRTYRGQMDGTSEELSLRGFVGVPLFGRTEKWRRALPSETCQR